jgi:hypothetical protein
LKNFLNQAMTIKNLALPLVLFCSISLRAGDLDTIGVTVLRQIDPTVAGTGVRVAQPEAGDNEVTNWEVTPSQVGQPTSLFTYISADGSSTNFPNSLSSDSGHADGVAANFYGLAGFYGVHGGVATNVAHVDNYDANFFVQEDIMVVGSTTNYIVWLPASNINDQVVNQSFIFEEPNNSHVGADEQEAIDATYDDYAAQYNTLFVSAAGNGGPVNPPATCYNGLGVGVWGGGSSYGPTLDNGRCKPDIIAPNSEDAATSFSAPYVAGTAAVLLQAGNRGDGGANTNAATDIRTIKALIINGAVKPSDWTNGTSTPLDARYGAGMLNVFNSWEQMKGGQHPFIESASITSGAPHPPGANTNNEPVLAGWDYNAVSTTSTQDTVNHYYFQLLVAGPFTLTATLVWNKQNGASTINNLDLFLYDTASGNLITCSTSLVDNVEHIYLPTLPAGRYDLQVLKQGSAGQVSASETYALAYEMFTMPLSIQTTNGNEIISWPSAPTGFQLESATSLAPPVSWVAITNAVTVTTNQNTVTLPPGGNSQFFQLLRPSF